MDSLFGDFQNLNTEILNNDEKLMVAGGRNGPTLCIADICDGHPCCKETENASTAAVCTGDVCDQDQNTDLCA